jgi:hypothetical protein
MPTISTAKPSATKPKPIAPGQIWKLCDRYLLIVHVGKLLAQYKELRSLTQRGGRTEFTQIVALQQMLLKNKAKMVRRPAPPVVAKG